MAYDWRMKPEEESGPAFPLRVSFALFRGQRRGYWDRGCSGPSQIWVLSVLKLLWHEKYTFWTQRPSLLKINY